MDKSTYYQNNKHKWARDTEEKKERHRQLSRESAARHRERRDTKSKEWTTNNYARVLYNQAKRGSVNRKLEFNLEYSDIVIPTHCPYLEILLTTTQGQGIVWTNASIDRINNNKGYVKGNIMIISRLANSMKQHSSIENLIMFSKNTLRMFNNDNSG